MPASKTKSGSQKKRTSKVKTRFYVVQTLQDAQRRLTDKLDAYNRRYIADPLKAGKTFVADLKTEPRKTAAKLVDDGKARVAGLNKNARNRVDDYVKSGQAFLTKAGKKPGETWNDLMDDGKELADDIRNNTQGRIERLLAELKKVRQGVEKDTHIVLDEIIDSGKKALDQFPGKQRVEKEISSRLETVPARLNLPSKKDIDSLVRRVKQLNAKVEALNKAQVAQPE